jgi:predicted cupin superfamily sugar epimerase
MPVDPLPGRSAAEIIRLLDLQPHPEGGFFRETFRDPARDARGRAVSTLIYFLLEAGQVSRWRKVDATEVWHFYAGAPLEITISQNGNETSLHRLGPDLFAGERPQFVVPAHCWQTAMTLGAWTLVGDKYATPGVACEILSIVGELNVPRGGQAGKKDRQGQRSRLIGYAQRNSSIGAKAFFSANLLRARLADRPEVISR